MAYIGNQNYQAYVTLNNQTFTTSGSTTIYALNYTVTNANNLDLYIGGSKQQPGVAYTANGNTLTLTTATSSSMYAVYLGQGIQTVQPGTSSVGTSQITTGAVGVSQLSATGTPSSATFLRGDNTWASAGTMQLRFIATTNSATNMTSVNTFYKTTWNQKQIDNFNEFNASTYTFTASSTGNYFFQASQNFRLNNTGDYGVTAYYKNGSAISSTTCYQLSMANSDAQGYTISQFYVSLNSGDTINIYAAFTNSSGTNRTYNNNAVEGEAVWLGYKIG